MKCNSTCSTCRATLVVEGVLGSEEVATLNELLDRQKLPPPGKVQRFGSAPEGPGFLQWGKPFCDLLDHPRIMPILRFRLGDCFRLDRLYGMYMREGMPRGLLHADYGATSPNSGSLPGEYTIILVIPRFSTGLSSLRGICQPQGQTMVDFAVSPAVIKATASCPKRYLMHPTRRRVWSFHPLPQVPLSYLPGLLLMERQPEGKARTTVSAL